MGAHIKHKVRVNTARCFSLLEKRVFSCLLPLEFLGCCLLPLGALVLFYFGIALTMLRCAKCSQGKYLAVRGCLLPRLSLLLLITAWSSAYNSLRAWIE